MLDYILYIFTLHTESSSILWIAQWIYACCPLLYFTLISVLVLVILRGSRLRCSNWWFRCNYYFRVNNLWVAQCGSLTVSPLTIVKDSQVMSQSVSGSSHQTSLARRSLLPERKLHRADKCVDVPPLLHILFSLKRTLFAKILVPKYQSTTQRCK